jgi:2-methylcitrate dehydratase PrpD
LGFTGDERMIDDQDGFHRALGSELADHGALTRDLGVRWWIDEARPKRYPTGTHNQQASHAFAAIVRDNNLRAEDIRSITVGRAIGTDGLFANQWPRNYVAAQFSLPFALAALACGVAPREWDGAFEDPRVRAVAARVTLRSDPRAIADFAALPADESRSPWSARTLIEVVAESGTFVRWSEYPSFTDAEAAAKLREYCAGVLDEDTMDAVIDGVLHLETLSDARELTVPFAQRAAA